MILHSVSSSQVSFQSWPIRNALVEVVGLLIIELADSDASADQDSRQVQKQISRLYELLIERMLDMSSYVRTKVLSVFSRLCDIKKAKFPKQRLAVTRAAISALEDKVATVRKNAVAVLSKLLLTHPYGLIHGGTLELNLFESQYKAVKDQLDKLEGTIGNAVDRQQGEDDDDEQGNGEDDGEKSADEEEEQEDEMDGGRPKRKGKKGKKRLIYAPPSFASADPPTDQGIGERMIWTSMKRTKRMLTKMKTKNEMRQKTLWTKMTKRTVEVGVGKRSLKSRDVNPNLMSSHCPTSRPRLQR